MVEINKASIARDQYRALMQVRWVLFKRSLRSKESVVLLVLRIIFWSIAGLFVLGICIGFGFATYLCVEKGRYGTLTGSLGLLMVIWQGYVLLRSTTSHNVSRELLRFPMRFRTYASLWTLSGIFDMPTILGGSLTLAIFMGALLADAPPIPALFAALSFFLLNVALSRTVLLWMEKLLAKRRIREVVVLLFSFVGFLPYLMRNYGKAIMHHLPQSLRNGMQWLPGSLFASALMRNSSAARVWSSAFALVLLTVVFASLVLLRLRTLYRGENLHEATDGPRTVQEKRKIHEKRLRQGGSSKVPAIVWENEFRKLWHNGSAMFQLVSPLLIVVFFGIRWAHSGPYLLPGATIYLSLDLGGKASNSLGADGPGAQVYRMAPVSMRDVMLGKNLATFTIYAAQMVALIAIAVFLSHIVPVFAVFSACFAMFALSVYFAMGNKTSLRRPVRIDAGKLDIQSLRAQRRARGANSWRTLVVLFGVPGFGAALLTLSAWYHMDWLMTAVMFACACVAAVLYKQQLASLDRIGAAEMETAINILSKTN
ncbi:MAG: hypothetical protein JSS87_10055 [Acidobacteria bacterium]|nr:hypothetical protein [Acidobacteriota bacterium]